MTSALESRLARLEGATATGLGRTIAVAGGHPGAVAEYLASFGVAQTPLDTVTHVDRADEMVLESSDDWGVMLGYVAKYGKSIVSLDEDGE